MFIQNSKENNQSPTNQTPNKYQPTITTSHVCVSLMPGTQKKCYGSRWVLLFEPRPHLLSSENRKPPLRPGGSPTQEAILGQSSAHSFATGPCEAMACVESKANGGITMGRFGERPFFPILPTEHVSCWYFAVFPEAT